MSAITRRNAGMLLGAAATAVATRSAFANTPAAPVLDHIVWAVPDLEEGRRTFEAMTGVLPVHGGIAPGRSQFHNALASLGDGSYVEVFASKIAMTRGPWLDAIADGKPHLVGYGMQVHDRFEKLLQAMPKVDVKTTYRRAMSRQRPDGVKLEWEIMMVESAVLGPLTPFFIDWMDAKPHPSEDSPKGIANTRFEMRHPDPGAVRRIFDALQMDIPVVAAPRPSLAMMLKTAKGEVLLDG